MPSVHLVCVGPVQPGMAEALGRAVTDYVGCETHLQSGVFDPDFAYDPGRGQHNSTEILKRLEAERADGAWRILGITAVDLFIPVLTFVFGEAFLNRKPAIVSLHRLHPEFYGLPANPELLLRRARTEAIHELGHTFGLIHCPDYACVMRASRVADEIDLKGPGFCSDCATDLEEKSLRPLCYREDRTPPIE